MTDAGAKPNPLDSVAVVLVQPRNSLNIGAVARAVSNFGFRDLRLVAPYDVAYAKARSAVGPSRDLLASAPVFESLVEAITDATLVVGTASIENRHLQLEMRRLETGAAAIRRAISPDRKHPHKVALLFGSERFGLTNHEMAHCHWLMRIPTREAHESMNLGQAVAICLYELVRAPGEAKEQDAEGVRQSAEAAPPPGLDPAEAEDVERVTTMLLGLLEDSGYVKPRIESSTHLKIRRMIRRMKLNATDAQNLLGMFKKIRWKLDQD